MNLKITASEKWLIMKALEYFTEDSSLERFLEEYDVDQVAMAKDLSGLLTKLESSKQESGK